MSFAATLVIPVLTQVDAWLKQSVTSALRQTADCEVLVVTSPRTSSSNLSVLSRLQPTSPDLTILRQTREGFAAAVNQGISEASTPRIGLLLSDDWLEPDTVEQCLKIRADIVSTGLTTYAADGSTPVKEASHILTLQEYSCKLDLEQKADYLGHFLLMRRPMLLEIGGLDESLGDSPGVDDYDLIWVLLEHGASVAIIEKQLYNYRDHEGDRLTLRKRSDMINTLKKILIKHKITDARMEHLLGGKMKWLGRPIRHVLYEVPSAARGQII